MELLPVKRVCANSDPVVAIAKIIFPDHPFGNTSEVLDGARSPDPDCFVEEIDM
jgi:hypothetical protein